MSKVFDQRCSACGHVAGLVHVHGHAQCERCGVNTFPCCQPDDSGEERCGPVVLAAKNLAHVPHGFATRLGGVSQGIFASLNFGNPGDLPSEQRDPRVNIEANIELLFAAINARGRRLAEVHQVHSAAVHVMERTDSLDTTHANIASDPKADAIVTNDARLIVGVRTADCAPILLASADGKVVGAVHAGWRGVVGGVVAATIERMRRLSNQPICASVGPCIGVDAFEVGPEVAQAFEREFSHVAGVIGAPSDHQPKHHIDLHEALCEQLRKCNVQSIDVQRLCTASNPALFFSHRKSGGRTGRHLSCIGPI
jgi:polyphenol oxidase